MKFKSLALAALLAAATVLPAYAQGGAVSTTTTTAATPFNGGTITVTSTAGMTSGGPATGAPVTTSGGATFLYVDLEQMRVMQVLSATQVQVQRGLAGFTSIHANGATVYFGPGTAFKSVDPPIGQCVPSQWLYTPWINVANGNMSVCQYRGTDTYRHVYTVNSRLITYNSTPQPCVNSCG